MELTCHLLQTEQKNIGKKERTKLVDTNTLPPITLAHHLLLNFNNKETAVDAEQNVDPQKRQLTASRECVCVCIK